MTPYSQQLRDGADKVEKYLREHGVQVSSDGESYKHLAETMRQAAELDQSIVESAIHGIARMVIDSFPLTDDFAPSFGAALLAVQHAERRRRRERRSN